MKSTRTLRVWARWLKKAQLQASRVPADMTFRREMYLADAARLRVWLLRELGSRDTARLLSSLW